MAGRSNRQAFIRAVAMLYGLLGLLPAILLFLLLPLVVQLRVWLSRGRAEVDWWWPLTSWFRFVGTLPRLAEWLERKLG